MKKILFTGGGTGGHIFPIISVAEEIIKNDANVSFSYIGPKDFTAKTFLPPKNIKTYFIFSGKIRRFFSFESIIFNFIDIVFKIPLGIIQAFSIMFFTAPDLIFSKGGFGSIPVIVAGVILRIPIFTHESDSVPGLANKIGGFFSKKIFTSFEEYNSFPKEKVMNVGIPVRKSLIEGKKEDAFKEFDLVGNKSVILILGGSQGSERINDVIIESLPELLNDFEVIHQTGLKDIKRVIGEASATVEKELLKYYHPYFFLDEEEMARAYAVADYVIGRSGGGMISEISLLGKPSILIPLPESAQDHQKINAYAYAKNGSCLVLEEPNFTKNFFIDKLKNIDKEKMSQMAKEFSKPKASESISQEILNFLN